MYKILFTILTLLFPNQNDYLLDQLYSELGWEFSEALEDDSQIYYKQIENIDLKAIKITRDIFINPEKVLETIKDIDAYNTVLKSSPNLVTTPILHDEDILAKHDISVPIFSDLYYFFKIFESDKKVYWVLQNPDMYKTNNSSGYSLNTGCGGWDYTKNDDGSYKISYTLIFDIDSYPDWFVNYLNYNSLINVFNDVVLAAQNRS